MGENTPIKISIYDFFAYTIPGGFYLFTIAYLCTSFDWFTIDLKSFTDLSLAGFFVIAILAYVTGFIFDPIAALWHRLFKRRNLAQVILDKFMSSHPSFDHLTFKFKGKDWAILLAFLRQKNIAAATEIERYSVLHIMLRNISLSLLALSVIEVVQYYLANSPNWHLGLSYIFFVVSIIAGLQGAKFNRWFYLAAYEAIVASALTPSDLVTPRDKTPSAPKG